MKCPECGLEMVISKTWTEVRGDDSPDKETIVETVQDLSCRNPQCPNYQTVVKTVRNKVEIG